MNNKHGSTSTLSKSITHISTKTLRKLAPELSKKIARKMLLTPKRTKNRWPRHVKQFNTETRFGRVRTYKYGEGKCIWLIHGWSSCAYDFWPLMQQLAERGYSCMAFDFPAHGASDGKQSSLPQMINAFEDISASFLDPSLVITHALGASIVANSQWFNQCSSDLLLISPVLNCYELLQKLVNQSGFDQVLFDQTIHDILRKEKLFMPELNAIPKLKNYNGQLKIIHDKQDITAPLSMSKQLTEQSEAKLFTTNKLGHNKILRSKNVLKVIESFTAMSECHKSIA